MSLRHFQKGEFVMKLESQWMMGSFDLVCFQCSFIEESIIDPLTMSIRPRKSTLALHPGLGRYLKFYS